MVPWLVTRRSLAFLHRTCNWTQQEISPFVCFFVFIYVTCIFILYVRTVGYRQSTSEGWQTKYYRGSMASIEFVTFRTGKYSIWNITGETQMTSVNFRIDQSFLSAASPAEPTGDGNFSLFVCFMLYLCNMNNLYYVCVPVKHQWGVEDEILSGKHGIDRICDFPYWQIFYMKHCRGNANDICQLPYRSIISKHRKFSRTYRWRKFFPSVCFCILFV